MIYVRAIHFAATLLAAGVALFLVFVAEPAFRDGTSEARLPAILRPQLIGIAWIGLALAAISGAAWLVLTAAEMSGEPLAAMLSDGTFWTVLSRTTFGNDWLARFVLACLLAAALAPFRSERKTNSPLLKAVLAIVAAAFAGTLAWAGHAAGGIGLAALIHPAADVLHLIAAAAWVGALLPLLLMFAAAAGDRPSFAIARIATLHFSTLGIVSVGTLLATGAVNTWYLAGSIPALVGTDYGRLLLAKIALFLIMVAIAALNRLQLTPRIVQETDQTSAQAALRQLRRNATTETLLGAIVIAIVAVLGTLPPGSHAAHHHEQSGPVPAGAAFVHIHSEQGMIEVTIMPGRTGIARAIIHLWNDDYEALEAKAVTLTLTPPVAGSPSTTRVASPGPDEAWQVDRIRLAQPGNWTVAVDALLSSGKRLVLDAPIVIDAN